MSSGFEPVFDENSRILILGSFPSVISREVNFYYGNPRNRFWSTLATIFNQEIPKSIEEKTEFLLHNQVAIWDVCKTLDIKGSSDNDIKRKNSVAVDIEKVLGSCKISKILCNGKKAYELFNYHFTMVKIPVLCLPSTSPANVRFDIEIWKRAFNK